MNTSKEWVSVCVLVIGLLVGTASAVNIVTVPVGNPGNAADDTGYGSVGYTYNIGKYEVTAGQYTEFLNKVAQTDTYGLYNTNMDTGFNSYGCNIKRTGASGSYNYSVASGWANRPVNFVSWGDSARFSNWMHNGQPTGTQNASTTEDGSYALNGAMSNADLLAVTRKANATWVIPSEDEWYKAAYYKGGSTSAGYWDYPTSSDSTPSNILGNPTDPGNNATYYNGSYTIGSQYYRTEVGAHENSDSSYGTFDQGGNVWEWNEAVIGSSRGHRGGSFIDSHSNGSLRASYRSDGDPTVEGIDVGFRVAYVPEPCSALMVLVGTVGLALVRRRG